MPKIKVQKSAKKCIKMQSNVVRNVVKKSDDTSLKLVPSVRVEMRFIIPLSRASSC